MPGSWGSITFNPPSFCKTPDKGPLKMARRLARISWGRYLHKPQEERRILSSLIQQTPGSRGIWGDVEFTIDRVEKCDFLLIADQPSENIEITVPPENVWSFTIEPPNEYFRRLHTIGSNIARCYTSDATLIADNAVHTFVPINWHVGLSFDELVALECPKKERQTCFITSSSTHFQGHKERINFLTNLAGVIPFHLFGRGYADFDRKFDVSAPYKNSVVVENFSNSLYWSEKLADAFLSYCLPLYYGCSKIADYFPADSFIGIDIHSPDVFQQLAALDLERLWRERYEAIRQARSRVLYEYNFFAFFAHQILLSGAGKAQKITIPASSAGCL